MESYFLKNIHAIGLNCLTTKAPSKKVKVDKNQTRTGLLHTLHIFMLSHQDIFKVSFKCETLVALRTDGLLTKTKLT